MRAIARDPVAIAVIVAAHALACALALSLGFDHVSDDDFARVTIAQTFAVAPKLDPSGTSWLPFPFWWLGTSLAIFGRTLVAARVASVLFASAAFAAPYLAMRFVGVTRGRALLGSALGLFSAWTLWLGASTVPESFTASFTTAGAIALGALPATPFDTRRRTAALLFAVGILAACLSRYEAWPVAAVLGTAALVRLFLLARTLRAPRAEAGLSIQALSFVVALAVLGPLAWMAWNAHAHDGPLHFFRRVSNFKRAIGEGSTDTLAALLLYPRLLVTTRPEIVLAAAIGLPALRAAKMRERWLVPLACGLAQLAFLAYGNARDGAPAHHAERALLATTMLLAAFAADAALETLAAAHGRWRLAAIAIVSLAWATSFARGLADPPGRTAAEDRHPQLERGAALRREGSTNLIITPCAYEHFALLAAYGAPERADIRQKTGAPVSAACPQVDTSGDGR